MQTIFHLLSKLSCPIHTHTIPPAHRFISNHPFLPFFPSHVSLCIPPLSVYRWTSSPTCSLSCTLLPVFVFNWMKRWCIMREERNMRKPKSMSPAAIETSSYLLLTFFSTVFYALLKHSSFMFVHALRAFISPIAACLWCKVTEHHKIPLSTATRVSVCVSEYMCLCVCVCIM